MATLSVPSYIPTPSQDAEELRKAFSGWGTNEGLIVNILAHRNAMQRRHIRHAYTDAYQEDLLKALDKELTRDFERVVLLWTLEPPERDALLAYDSARKWNQADRALIEIACSRSSDDLHLARKAYHIRYKRSLEEDVAAHTKGDFRMDLKTDPKDEFLGALRAITKCLTCPEKYFEKVVRCAINKMGTDEGALTRVVTTRTEVDMKLIKDLYYKRNSVPLDRAIKKDTTGDYEDFLIALIGQEDA